MDRSTVIIVSVVCLLLLLCAWSVAPTTTRSTHTIVRIMRLLPIGILIFVAGAWTISLLSSLIIRSVYDAHGRDTPEWFYSLWKWVALLFGVAAAAVFMYRDFRRKK